MILETLEVSLGDRSYPILIGRDLAVEIASLPEEVRGYGYIKEENVVKVNEKLKNLMGCWRNPASRSEAA